MLSSSSQQLRWQRRSKQRVGIAVAELLAAQRQPDDRPQHGDIGTERGRKTPCGRDLEAEKNLVWKEKRDLKLIITFSGLKSHAWADYFRIRRALHAAPPTRPPHTRWQRQRTPSPCTTHALTVCRRRSDSAHTAPNTSKPHCMHTHAPSTSAAREAYTRRAAAMLAPAAAG